MIIKKYWKTVVAILIVAGLFAATAVLQSNASDVEEPYTRPEVDETTSSNVSAETPQHLSTFIPPLSGFEVIIEDPVEDVEPQTSGYNITYVDEDFDRYLLNIMEEFNINIDISYVYATIFCESTFRKSVESYAGAIGYMQVLPSTRDYIYPMIVSEFPQYADISKDLTDPHTNVIYGLYLFSHIAENFGYDEVTEESMNKILTCYNMGITGGRQFFNAAGHWDSNYAKKIIEVAKQIRTDGGL